MGFMTDEKKTAKSETTATEHSVEAAEPATAKTVSSEPKEPKATSAKSSGAKPAARIIAPGQVVGSGDTDTIRYSSAKPSAKKRVLSVLHVQRALAELGYAEAASAPGGHYETLTRNAVIKYQISRGDAQTGVLTRAQFTDLFEGDPNVTVEVDTHEDHAV